MRKDGTCFVNLGDTYSAHKDCKSVGQTIAKGTSRENAHCIDKGKSASRNSKMLKKMGMPDKCLCCIPDRFRIEMIKRGWILRNRIIWHKPNPMPSSAKDRFTVDFEDVMFFVKQKRYYFEPQYEPYDGSTKDRTRSSNFKGVGSLGEFGRHTSGGAEIIKANPLGRNKRTVWTIPTQAYSEAHFATFPEALVRPMILSGCPEFVCKKCGLPRVKVYDKEIIHNRPNTRPDANVRPDNYERIPSDWQPRETTFKGYTDCGCGAGWRPGICLDMFRWLWNSRHGSRPVAA